MNITRVIIGQGADPQAYIWFLAWWPFAISHHLNPFWSTYVWQPAEVNLGWMASISPLALLAMPVTWADGAMLSYNVLIIAAPALSAIGAYALCLYVARQPPAAMLGGYLFGFSTYEMAQSIAHLNLSFTVFVPLLLLVVLVRLDDGFNRRSAVLWAVLCLACQFAISLEIFATEIFIGGLAWGVAWLSYPHRRAVLNRLVIDGLTALPCLAAVLSPWLWAMFALPHHFEEPPDWPKFFSIDPLNLVVPTLTTRIGGAVMAPFARHFTAYGSEQAGYCGVLLLAIMVAYCRRHCWFFAVCFCLIIVLSCGPQLWLGGWATGLPLPWALVERLPFLADALPARLMLFAALLAALIAAMWAAEAPPGRPKQRRLLAARLACIMLVPSTYAGQPDPSLAFFKPGHVQAALGPGAKLLILPFGMAGSSCFWQVESQFGFIQTGGYVGVPDLLTEHDIPMLRLFAGLEDSVPAAEFATYARRTGTDYVVIAPGVSPLLLAQIKSLAWPMRRIDDVSVVTVPRE